MQSGFHYLWQGIRHLSHPKLRHWVWIPLLINIVLSITIFWIGLHFIGDLIHWLLSLLPHWLAWLKWLLWPFFIITVLVIFAYTFTLLANLVAGPFNGVLAEKTAELLGHHPPSSQLSLKASITDIPRILGRSGLWLLYYLPRLLLYGLLFFIPVINIIAPFTWYAFNSWAFALQYLDYPADNERISFKQLRRAMKSQRITYLTFGITVLLLTMIPLVNLFIMPASVIGATIAWYDANKLEDVFKP